MNYVSSVQIVCSKLKSALKNNDEFIKNVVELFEDKLSVEEDYIDINTEDDIANFMNYPVMASGEIKYMGKNFFIYLRRYTINNNLMLSVDIGVEENYKYTGINDVIYDLKIEIKNILSLIFKDIYWQRDDHNSEICKDLYGRVYILENQFRQLIVEFMVKKYGYDWNKKLVGKLFKRKITEYSKWYKDNYREFSNVYIDLFNLQADDLIKFLENAYEVEQADVEVKQYFKSESICDKLVQEGENKVSDIIKNDMTDILKKYSVWNLYIRNILGIDFKDSWLEFSKMRNMVAHNRPICKELYNDFIKKENYLNDRFDKLKSYISEHFDNVNKERIDLLENKKHIELQNYDDMCREEAGLNPMPNDEDEVFDEINENEEIIELLNEIQEYVSIFKEKSEELIGCLEEINYNSLKEEVRELIITKVFKKDISKISYSEELFNDDINRVTDELNYKIKNIKCEDYFSIGILADLYGIWNKNLIISVEGDICIEEGHTDEINIKLMNEQIIEVGKILKTYGEYSISDYGAAVPEVEDDLIIYISNIQKKLEENFKDTLNYLDDSINLIENK